MHGVNAAGRTVMIGARRTWRGFGAGATRVAQTPPVRATLSGLNTVYTRTGLRTALRATRSAVNSPVGQTLVAAGEITGAIYTGVQITKASGMMDEATAMMDAAVKMASKASDDIEVMRASTGMANEAISEATEDAIRQSAYTEYIRSQRQSSIVSDSATADAIASASAGASALPSSSMSKSKNPLLTSKNGDVVVDRHIKKVRFLLQRTDPLLVQQLKEAKIPLISMEGMVYLHAQGDSFDLSFSFFNCSKQTQRSFEGS